MAAPQVPAGPESQRSAPAEGAVGMSAGDPLKDIWGGKRGKYLPRPVCSWPLPQAGPGQGVNPWPPDWRQAVQMESNVLGVQISMTIIKENLERHKRMKEKLASFSCL